MSLCDIYRGAIQFRTKLDPEEWARRNVRLFRSTDSTFYRPEYTPWWGDVMRAARDNKNREICVTTPVGSGKSTLVEALTCNILDGDPGPMLLIGQTDTDAEDWAETGLWPAVRACVPLQNKLPVARGKWRRASLIMPRSPVHITGANVSGTQSKSERWVIGDEAWLYDPERFKDIRARLHRRWNGRSVFLGQAGFLQLGDEDEVVGDEWTLSHHNGEQWEWCFACPGCGDVQAYELAQLLTPDGGTPAERASAAVYECQNCKSAFGDTPKSRRAFATASRYERKRAAILPGHISYHLNALALFRSPWRDVAVEHLQAQAAMSQGRNHQMQQFVQKQMALPWDDSQSIERPDLDLVEENAEHYAAGKQIDSETIRFMTVDTQRDHFWVLVRAWRGDASSLAIYYGKINTEETIEQLRAKMGVEPHHVYVDSGYDAGRVYDICARYGWVAIKGDSVQCYKHKARGGGFVERLMSPRKRVLAPCGKGVYLIHLAVDSIKDILARLRGGQGAGWQAVSNIGEAWSSQLDTEERGEFLNPATNQASSRWVKKKRDNHSWDNEVYQVGAALIWKIFKE